MPQPPVAILGAGPSGLTLARFLEMQGIDYVVYERDASRSERPQGGSLDLHVGSGQLAMRQAGLWDELLKLARYDAPTMMTDKTGKVVLRMDPEPGEGMFDRPEVDRSALRTILLDSIPAARIQWSRMATEVVKQDDGSMAVRFVGGATESGFRLVVGADGARSRARSAVTSAEPEYCGLTYLATSVDPNHRIYPKVVAMAEKGTHNSMGTGKMLTVQYTGDGRYNMYVGLKLPHTWQERESKLMNEPASLREWLVEGPYSDWAPALTDVIKYSEGNFRLWSLCSMPIEWLDWSSNPGVTLVGDAAHVTYPNGEGVNNAMLDSLQLAQSIQHFGLGHIARAVAEYEKSMFSRAREHIRDGLNTKDMMFGQDAPTAFVKMFEAHTSEKLEKLTMDSEV